MSYIPHYTVTPRLVALIEEIAALQERIQGAAVEISWIPALQKDTRMRNTHASTAIEGNPLTLEQVRALEEGRELSFSDPRSRKEILNYLAGLRHIEKNVGKKSIRHEDLFRLHGILAKDVMDQGAVAEYRRINVRVGKFMPPPHKDVSGLMFELLQWWNKDSRALSPVLSSAILHHRFETIHPFADGNGRMGRALSLWELYRRGFDTHHIFSVDEFYWENRPNYYKALDAVRRKGDDLTCWLEYSAQGLKQTLQNVWMRMQSFRIDASQKLTISPKQELLLGLLRDNNGMTPRKIWNALGISRQGAMNLLNPLLDAGIVEKVGGKKTGRYILRQP